MSIDAEHEEKELLDRLRKGDEKAFAALYNIYKDVLGYRLLRLVKSESLTEELLQDLFMKVWENRAQIDLTKSFKSYLFRIAENSVFDLFRRANRERHILTKIQLSSSEIYTHVEEFLFKKGNKEMLHQVIDLLPTRRKEVFVLCKIEGLSYQEVADRLGTSVNTVNDHIQKATEFLKTKLTHPSRLSISIFMFYFFSDI